MEGFADSESRVSGTSSLVLLLRLVVVVLKRTYGSIKLVQVLRLGVRVDSDLYNLKYCSSTASDVGFFSPSLVPNPTVRSDSPMALVWKTGYGHPPGHIKHAFFVLLPVLFKL